MLCYGYYKATLRKNKWLGLLNRSPGGSYDKKYFSEKNNFFVEIGVSFKTVRLRFF